MKYSPEDIEEILFNGTQEQMEALSASETDAPIEFDSSSSSLQIKCGSEIVRMYNRDGIAANCIRFFGKSHKFR